MNTAEGISDINGKAATGPATKSNAQKGESLRYSVEALGHFPSMEAKRDRQR